MKREQSRFKSIAVLLIPLFLAAGFTTTASALMAIDLSDEQVENIVRRSYQYVAMYNVIQKFALDPASGRMYTDGFNKPKASTTLADHNMTSIARPNNDTLYQVTVLDLRLDPVIIEFPAIDSKYVVLETSGYDHYVGVPLATSKGDFKIPTKVLFYTDRTEGYHGQKINGVDRIVKADGNFIAAFLRAMPHQADPARMKRIIEALTNVKVLTLSEFQGKPAKDYSDVNFPAYGKSDADVFANNLPEVMQFVFNHTTFDPNNAMDQALLAAYKPFGIEPGKTFKFTKVAELKGPRLRKVANQVAQKALVDATDPALLVKAAQLFMPKGQIDLEVQVVQSVTGPIGLPAYQARYLLVVTKDGKPMNAQHDYVLKMSKDELPPATAFWSLTLYDQANGFFIPNVQKKYSVGENAGFKLNAEGGIKIVISAKKPEDVPNENWLPINRDDIELSLMYRIYAPDAEKMKTWKMPQPEIIGQFAFAADAPIKVNVDNFVRAETASQFDRALKTVGDKVNTWGHLRTPPPLDAQIVIRMNRDTLYGSVLLDISKGATLTIPETGDRYLSIMVVNEDHYINRSYHDAGTYELTMEEFHTPYVFLIARILVNSSDPADIKEVNILQDQITTKAASAKPYTHPNYDQVSYKATYKALIELSRGVAGTKRMFGKKEEVGEVRHLLGTAFGWGGLPESEAYYLNVEPNLPVGAYQLTVKDVPVDAFWSISLYNRIGYFQRNEHNAYSVNNITGKRNKDGSFTVHFGGDPKALNYLPIMEGWNYIVRLYQPRNEILDGTWTFPNVVPVQ